MSIENENIILASLMSLLAAFFSALGDNLVKLSFVKEKMILEENRHAGTFILCRPLWVMGMIFLVVLNTFFTLESYSLVNPSVVIPLTGSRMVFNLPLAHYINHEHVKAEHIFSTLFVCLGVVIVSASASAINIPPENNQTNSELFSASHFLYLNFALFSFTSLIFLNSQTSTSTRSKCVSLAVCSGIFASVTQLFAKIWTENGDWSFLFIAMLLALIHFSFLNAALKNHEAYLVSPFSSSTFILFGSVYTAVFFQQTSEIFTASFTIGLLFTVFGALLLAFAKSSSATQIEPIVQVKR